MFTLGYSFRPWREPRPSPTALDPSLHQAAAHQHGVDRRVRYHRRCACRLVVIRRPLDRRGGERRVRRARAPHVPISLREYRLLPLRRGYSPRFEGASDFGGASSTPALAGDLEWEDRSVVVIGSGATAVTLVPALAARASHVTMLQRSPSYVMSLPEHDGIADLLRHLLPERLAYPLVRWKTCAHHLRLPAVPACTQADGAALEEGCGEPAPGRLRRGNPLQPRYSPWDQRLCFVPTATSSRH